jgi:hypothetical protein
MAAWPGRFIGWAQAPRARARKRMAVSFMMLVALVVVSESVIGDRCL